jgi:hypothetical protein
MKYILIILILLICLSGCSYNHITSDFSLQEINNSINKAIDFLYENQLDYGEFKSLICGDKFMLTCFFDSSPFVTTFVLYSLKDVKNKKIGIMANKAIDFLLSEQEPGGIWRYWSSKNKRHHILPPDADDTACVSATLLLFNKTFEDNIPIFTKFSNNAGVVYTWFSENINWSRTNRLELGCEVNADVLFYFGLRGIKDTEICDFINNQILKENYNCCFYCEDRDNIKNYVPLFYVASRAYKHNNACLNKSKNHIIKKILMLQERDGSFGNDLDTAFALNTLLNFNYSGEEIDLGIGYLLQKQLKEGAWKRNVFYVGPGLYFGSEELTTAIAIEALNKYLEIKS